MTEQCISNAMHLNNTGKFIACSYLSYQNDLLFLSYMKLGVEEEHAAFCGVFIIKTGSDYHNDKTNTSKDTVFKRCF